MCFMAFMVLFKASLSWAELALVSMYVKSCKAQNNCPLNFPIFEKMEDDLQGRQPQQNMTFNNCESAKLALKHLKVKFCKAQTNFQPNF